MNAAFLTAALAAGLAAVALASVALWVVTVISGSPDAWRAAPWLLPVVGILFGAATYAAEWIARRRDDRRARTTGEPWAYRE